MRTRPGSAALSLALLAVAALAAAPRLVSAGSPSTPPSTVPSEGPPERPPFEVWLDRPVPTDAQPGDELDIGATIWDRLGEEIPRMGATIFLRVQPANGAGPPSQATARSDWPGHYRGNVEVPAGGLGPLELGVSGTICENDDCRSDDWVFDMGGVGPPPDAPISLLSEARIDVGADVVAGMPAGVTVVLTPQGDWESLPAPGAVVVRAREPRGPNVATASLPLTDPAELTYEGSITIPRSGDLVLEAATDADGGDGTRFGTSMIPIAVGQGPGSDTTEPAVPSTAPDDGPPTIVIVLLALVALAGAGVVVAGLRGGSR